MNCRLDRLRELVISSIILVSSINRLEHLIVELPTVPYGCALGLVLEATNCMVFPGLVSLTAIHSRTATFDLYNYIDPRTNLNGDKVFIFHGSVDTVVRPGLLIASLSELA